MTLHIIVAGGSGSRFGSRLPKQFCLMADKPVVCHAIDAIAAASDPCDITVIAVSPDMASFWADLADRYGYSHIVALPVGGATRVATVAAALAATAHIPADVVAIHDGARPLPPPSMVARVVEAASAAGSAGAVPAVPLTDSIRRIAPDGTSEAVSRAAFRAVQTPQAFPAGLIRAAYAAADPADPSLTDDASVAEAFTGRAPLLVDGSPDNIKITHPRDIAIAEAILRNTQS